MTENTENVEAMEENQQFRTVADLVALLLAMPQDLPIFTKDAEWGHFPAATPSVKEVKLTSFFGKVEYEGKGVVI